MSCPKHSQEKIACLIHFCAEVGNGFGKRLIDSFVEADHLLRVGAKGSARRGPQPEYGGTQRAVLRSELVDVKAGSSAQKRMRSVPLFPTHPSDVVRGPGTVFLLPGCLWTHDVSGNRFQNLLRVVPQSQ